MAPLANIRIRFHSLFQKVIAKWEAKKRTRKNQEKATSLMHAARQIHEEIEGVTADVKGLQNEAASYPRPETPPRRDPLFDALEGAPESEYAVMKKQHDSVVGKYHQQQEHFQMLNERVVNFDNEVKALRAAHACTPTQKLGKLDHDIEALENGGRNINGDLDRLRELLTIVEAAAKA